MSNLTLGRYNANVVDGCGSTLHKGLMLEEAKDMGYTGLTQATKEELNSLVNGSFDDDEGWDNKYKEIKQAIKERNSAKKTTNKRIKFEYNGFVSSCGDLVSGHWPK